MIFILSVTFFSLPIFLASLGFFLRTMKDSVHKYFSHGGVILILVATACSEHQKSKNARIEEVAGNEAVLNFMKTFNGVEDLSDPSQPVSPKEAVQAFRVAEDLAIDLILSEPDIAQPVFMDFDHRGRLWVAQYSQYPYPAGLKVMEEIYIWPHAGAVIVYSMKGGTSVPISRVTTAATSETCW